MENWQICEAECLQYLKKDFSDSRYDFEAEGGSDSTKSDILLTKSGIAIFYIETKMKQAQCGQFVVYQENSRFTNSTRNRHLTSFAEEIIIDKMNEKFASFANPGTAGKDLGLDKSYYYDWIMSYYESKKVRYFIVEKEVGRKNFSADNFIIFPIQHFYKYFDATAKYRVKKSGSTSPSHNSIDEIEDIFKKNKISYSDLHFEDTKVFVSFPKKSEKFQLEGINYDYQLNPQGNGKFEIRRLSNTRNANVIFSISLIQDQQERDLEKFRLEFN